MDEPEAADTDGGARYLAHLRRPLSPPTQTAHAETEAVRLARLRLEGARQPAPRPGSRTSQRQRRPQAAAVRPGACLGAWLGAAATEQRRAPAEGAPASSGRASPSRRPPSRAAQGAAGAAATAARPPSGRALRGPHMLPAGRERVALQVRPSRQRWPVRAATPEGGRQPPGGAERCATPRLVGGSPQRPSVWWRAKLQEAAAT
ncbi:unnamed protein product [Prorocentrum cordatum]|uniref:Uncharacterized protein n=1 Tax=Prorocentrum cordatum TaxID=2364126 RepID=A0ABN9WAZ7_9DINO|nr:unnamed protein product [Polarella glacialis]